MKTYDAVIIGFGKAGKTLAGEFAARGMKTAVVEKSEKMYGGTCINVGCIPSKFLVTSSKEAAKWIKDSEERKAFYRKTIEEKNALTAKLRQKNYDRLANASVDIYNGTASFSGPKTIDVASKEGNITLSADKILINTGSFSFIPPIKGIENPRVYTSETLMALEELPETLVIIGGGYIGLEFASMYAGFGSKVVILQDQPEFLPREDRDIADEILKVLQAKGIEFIPGVKVEEIADEDSLVKVSFTDSDGQLRTVKGNAVLAAAGRRPNTKGLALEKAGIETTKTGAVAINDELKTTNPNVWAAGDVNGGLQFTYVSLDDYRIIKSQLFGDGKYTLKERKNVPYSVFIDPPYSRVGLNEREAKAAGYDIKVAKLPVSSFPKAHVFKQTDGLMKAIVDAKTDRILGVMLFSPESYEQINLIRLAMEADMPSQRLRDGIYTHPTMTESLNDLFSLV